jgi:hypothetical protein
LRRLSLASVRTNRNRRKNQGFPESRLKVLGYLPPIRAQILKLNHGKDLKLNHGKELYQSDGLRVRVGMSDFGLNRHRVSLHALMVLFSLVPSLMGYTLYLTDIPNAVARITINLKLIADPSSSAFYFFRPVLIPNMALDVWGLLFGGWIGVENAVLIFVMLVIVLLYATVQGLRVVILGRTSLLVGALSLFLVQSGVFRWGLMNYELGTAIMFATLALTERHVTEPSGVSSPGNIVARSTLCLLSVMCSVFPTAIYGCYVAGRLPSVLEGQDWKENVKRTLALGVPFLPVLAFLAVAQNIPSADVYETDWTIYGKVSGIVALFYVRGPGLELCIAIAFAVALVILFMTCRFRVAPSQRFGLILMAVLYVVLPSRLLNVDAIDYRLAQPIALLLIASTELTRRDGTVWAGRARLVGATFVLLALVRPLIVIESLRPVDELRHSISRLFETVPSGSRVLVVTDLPEFRYFGHRIWHLPLLSAMEDRGDIFLASVFSNFFTQKKQALDKFAPASVQLGVDAFPDLCRWTHVLLIGHASSLPPSLPLIDARTDGASVMLDVDRTAWTTLGKPNVSGQSAQQR